MPTPHTRTAREVAALVRVSGLYPPARVRDALAGVTQYRGGLLIGEWAERLADTGEPGIGLALLLWGPPVREW